MKKEQDERRAEQERETVEKTQRKTKAVKDRKQKDRKTN